MDLTYTDSSWHDLGILDVTSSDWAYGSSENDFQLDLPGPAYPAIGTLVYEEGGELGGIVTGIKATSDSQAVTVTGDTWTGVLARKVIGPDSGSDYLTLTGDVRDIVASLVSRAGLTGLFTVRAYKPGITVAHTFKGRRSDSSQQDAGRYMSCWSAIWQVTSESGCKVRFAWDATTRRVLVTVSVASDLTNGDEHAGCVVEVKSSQPVNHLVCLGKGELAARAVAHVYLDASGKASTTQTITGVSEIANTYEDTQATGDDLIADGKAKILDLAADAVSVTVLAPAGVSLDLGDIVGGTDPVTGITASAIVSKRVVKTSGAATSYTYTTTIRS